MGRDMFSTRSFFAGKQVAACLATAAMVASAVLSGCGNKGGKTGGGGGNPNELKIITPHSADIQYEFERLFKEKNKEASIKWITQRGSTGVLELVLAQFGKKENKDEGIDIDIFFGGGPEAHQELDKVGALAPLKSDYKIPATLNGVPLRGEGNRWIGAALSGFGIVYNKSLATRDKLPVPKTWGDMGNPALRDRIVLADPRKSGSAHAAYEIILQTNGWKRGWEILTAMAGNASRFRDSSSELSGDVTSGEAVFAPAIDFYARTAIERAGGDKLGYIEPFNQRVITPDPISILRGAPNRKLADAFLDVVMSPEGQKLWMYKKGSKGGPVNNALYRQAALPAAYKPKSPDSLITDNPYDFKSPTPYDSVRASVRRIPLDELIGAVLIDNHKLIQTKWKSNPNAAQITFVPVSEEELLQLSTAWGDAAKDEATKSAWREAASKHFQ